MALSWWTNTLANNKSINQSVNQSINQSFVENKLQIDKDYQSAD